MGGIRAQARERQAIIERPQLLGLHAALVASAGHLLVQCRFLFGRILAPDDDLAPARQPL